MTFGKGAALGLGFAGAVALGVWIGPRITHRGAPSANATASAIQVPAASIDEHQTAREARRAPTPQRATTTPTTPTATTRTTSTSSAALRRTVPAAAPALHELLKPLLKKGADMGVASQEFANAAQFAAAAHAARNTNVPFMVLKHRIVDEGKSLEDAIREFKPDLNAAAEAARARAEAKSDISALEG
jgi:hypothetical protein